MADTVHVPGVKQPMPKWAVFAGLGGVGVAIFLYYRHKKAAAPASTATDQYPPDGTVGDPSDPYSTDPATGQTYGDEAVGSGGTFGAGSGDTGGGSGSGGDGGGGGGTGGGPPFSDNSSWANWAISQLEQNDPSISPGALTDAIGVYLNGQPATAAQRTIIFDAIAVAGDPPVAGPNNYPPKVRGDGGGGGKQNAENPVTDLKADVTGDATVTVSWKASKHATSYHVVTKEGTRTFSTHDVTGTFVELHSMKHGTRYTTSVLAKPAASGARSAQVTYTTRKRR